MKLSQCFFETGPIRPPSEGGSHSLLIRTTRNCSWNRCKFCYGIMYGREPFERRKVADIKKDIDTVKTMADEIKKVSRELGLGGNISQEVVSALLQQDPDLRSSQCFNLVISWLYSGAGTAFMQDANSMIMSTDQQVAILSYLTITFPSLTRITTYARSKTLIKKSLDELKEIRNAGLTRVHVGLETGDDDLLKYMDKGVTSNEHIEAGKKTKEAGLELSAYVMIDLGGRERYRQHAENTAKVLNEIDPDFIRFRPFMIGPDLPLFTDFEEERLTLSSPHGRLEEVKILVENLNITGRICFDHFLNAWYSDSSRSRTLFKQDYEGYKFPEQKQEVMDLIEKGLELDESVHLHYKDIMGMRHL